jgi:hypothetical protein
VSNIFSYISLTGIVGCQPYLNWKNVYRLNGITYQATVFKILYILKTVVKITMLVFAKN